MATGLFELTKWHETSTERGLVHGCIISKKRFDAFDRRVSNGLRDGFEGWPLRAKTVENAAKLGGVTLRTTTCSVYTQVWRNYPLRLGCLLNGEHSAASLFAVPLVFCGFAVVHLLASSDGFLDFFRRFSAIAVPSLPFVGMPDTLGADGGIANDWKRGMMFDKRLFPWLTASVD